MAANIFERLNRGRPPPIEATAKQQPQVIQHAQRMLDWLQHWDEPTISAKKLCMYGPRPRDRKSMVDSAKLLTEQGWLLPLKTSRYDALKWQIVRGPIIGRTVAKGS
jgi:hypothetical protein